MSEIVWSLVWGPPIAISESCLKTKEAAGQYRGALVVNPAYGRAQFGLGMALGARKHLSMAASGAEAGVKAEAAEVLDRVLDQVCLGSGI